MPKQRTAFRLSCIFLLLTLILPAGSAAEQRPSIGLALGSGGAAGLAHIRMLQVFDELQIKPDRIAGTSIGAIIGALYAAGLDAAAIKKIFDRFAGSELDVLTKLMQPSAKLDLGDLIDIDIANGALFDSSGFLEFLAEQISARTFEELKIPLEVIATDYWTGETIVLKDGDLFTAIKAGMAVPGLFTPVNQGDRLLIDGGTANPLPYDRLMEGHDIVVAVDVSGSRNRSDDKEIGWKDLVFSTFEIMQQSIIRQKLQKQRPTIYIKPDISGIRMLHFNRIETILEQSGPAADTLKAKLAEHFAK